MGKAQNASVMLKNGFCEYTDITGNIFILCINIYMENNIVNVDKGK